MTRDRATAPRRGGSLSRWADHLIEACALFLLVFAPLAYGTVEPWSEAIAELVVLGMAVVWMLRLLAKDGMRVELPPGWLPGALFLALVFGQSVPLPVGLVEPISPFSAAAYRTAAALGGGSASTAAVSLDPHATWEEAVKLLAAAVYFVVLYNCCRTGAQIRRLVGTMVVVGSGLSVFGIVQRVSWNGRFFWVGPAAPHASAFGPFVNRAHFAGLMVIVVPIAIGLVLVARRGSPRPSLRRGWRERLRHWSASQTVPGRLIPFLVVVMGGATLVSGSRGGVVSLVAVLLALMTLVMQGRSGVSRAARVALVAGVIVVVGLWIGGDVLSGTVTRLTEEIGRPDESIRLHLWSDALALWSRFPLLGSGLASFEVALPPVRTVQAPVVFTHAESDWVELLTDTGILGLALVMVALGAVVGALLRSRRGLGASAARPLALGGAVAVLGTAAQGIGNFGFVVMSNLLYLATAVAISLERPEAQPSDAAERLASRSGRGDGEPGRVGWDARGSVGGVAPRVGVEAPVR